MKLLYSEPISEVVFLNFENRLLVTSDTSHNGEIESVNEDIWSSMTFEDVFTLL
jgi:hypothetical protein